MAQKYVLNKSKKLSFLVFCTGQQGVALFYICLALSGQTLTNDRKLNFISALLCVFARVKTPQV